MALNNEDFNQRVSETAAWCNRKVRSQAGWGLWSEELRPRRSLLVDGSGGLKENAFWEHYNDQRQLIRTEVETIVARRAALLGDTPIVGPPQQSQFLLFSPFYATCDTLAHFESEKFFDLEDVPPWDTFIGYWIEDRKIDQAGNPYLDGIICWIPPLAINAAIAGTRVSIGSLTWIEPQNSRISPQLWQLIGSHK